METKGSAFERHGQTVLSGLILICITWVGTSINDLGKKQAAMDVQLSDLREQIKQATANTNGRIDDANNRIGDALSRVMRLEETTRAHDAYINMYFRKGDKNGR